MTLDTASSKSTTTASESKATQTASSATTTGTTSDPILVPPQHRESQQSLVPPLAPALSPRASTVVSEGIVVEGVTGGVAVGGVGGEGERMSMGQVSSASIMVTTPRQSVLASDSEQPVTEQERK